MTDNPFINNVRLVQPQRDPSGSMGVLVLERIEPGVTPDYCIHGKATCHWCNEWCWLGDQTHDLVASGEVAPICLQCATRVFPPDGLRPVEHVHDHRRADGPHT